MIGVEYPGSFYSLMYLAGKVLPVFYVFFQKDEKNYSRRDCEYGLSSRRVIYVTIQRKIFMAQFCHYVAWRVVLCLMLPTLSPDGAEMLFSDF